MARMPERAMGFFIVLAVAATAVAAKTSTERAKELGLALTSAPALRQPIYSGIAGDVYAHNDKAERRSDRTELAHEGTHGANSVIRNRYGNWDTCNAMYVGNNLAIVIDEPRIPLPTVARYVPGNMRGMAFSYFSLKDWTYNTLYIFDEWSAYVNCTWAGHEQGRVNSSDGLQMAEFTVYALAVVAATATTKPDYDLTQMRAAVAWMCERRVIPLLSKPGYEAGAQYWERFRTSQQTGPLRQFVRDWFGKQWTQEVMGF